MIEISFCFATRINKQTNKHEWMNERQKILCNLYLITKNNNQKVFAFWRILLNYLNLIFCFSTSKPISSRFTFNVSKFLMINLSIADLMMGMLLLLFSILSNFFFLEIQFNLIIFYFQKNYHCFSFFFSPSGVYLFIIAVVDLRTQGVYFNYAIDWQHG